MRSYKFQRYWSLCTSIAQHVACGCGKLQRTKKTYVCSHQDSRKLDFSTPPTLRGQGIAHEDRRRLGRKNLRHTAAVVACATAATRLCSKRTPRLAAVHVQCTSAHPHRHNWSTGASSAQPRVIKAMVSSSAMISRPQQHTVTELAAFVPKTLIESIQMQIRAADGRQKRRTCSAV